MSWTQYIITCILYTLKRRSWTSCTLPPTLRWFNTAGALLLGANLDDPNYLGGIAPGHAKQFIQLLDKWWGITDHDSAIEVMTNLLHSGMRTSFHHKMELFTLYRQQMTERNGMDLSHGTPTNNDILFPFWQEKGADALLGWDLCRAVFITTWCHVCGYLSFEEMMEICVSAGQMLQRAFSDWRGAMVSYLLGFFFWMDPETPEQKRKVRARVHLYKTLCSRNGPFATIPFTTPLSRTLSAVEKGQFETISN